MKRLSAPKKQSKADVIKGIGEAIVTAPIPPLQVLWDMTLQILLWNKMDIKQKVRDVKLINWKKAFVTRLISQ